MWSAYSSEAVRNRAGEQAGWLLDGCWMAVGWLLDHLERRRLGTEVTGDYLNF